MKNTIKVFGIIALVAVIGFSFAACGGDDDDNKQGSVPTITTATLPDVMVDTAYSQTLKATGDTPITWSLDSGTLPAGLSLAGTGVISGTPTTAATSSFTVKATNTKGSATKQLSITVTPPGGIFSLTGIPSEYNGKYISGWSQNIENPDANPSAMLIGGQSRSQGEVVTILISNGSANIPVWTNSNQRYTGNHTVGFIVQITVATTAGPFGDELPPKGNKAIIKWGFNSVTFSNGNATKNWTDGQNWQ